MTMYRLVQNIICWHGGITVLYILIYDVFGHKNKIVSSIINYYPSREIPVEGRIPTN
jgi:hypothetical protein